MWVERLTLALVCGVAVLGCGGSSAKDLFQGTGGEGGTDGSSGSSAGYGGTAGAGASGGTVGGIGGISGGGTNGASGVSGNGGVSGSGGVTGSGGSASAGSGGTGGGSCNFSGTWAAYSTIPLEWPETGVLNAGSGTLQVWLLTVRTTNGMNTSEIGHLCGIVLPPFATKLMEKHGVRFLAEAFDHMPEFRITAKVGAYEVGGSFNTDPAAIIFGATLPNPVKDTWPALAQLVKADDDRDGNPGVTTPAERGPGFADPVVALSLDFPRANVLHVASRTVVIMRGSAHSCDELRGSLEVPLINGTPAFDSAIVGCKLAANGQPCSDVHADFVNTNGPDFRPTAGSTFVQKRVRDGFTCGEVRGMYPALPTP
jgi:hypothetical protein